MTNLILSKSQPDAESSPRGENLISSSFNYLHCAKVSHNKINVFFPFSNYEISKQTHRL